VTRKQKRSPRPAPTEARRRHEAGADAARHAAVDVVQRTLDGAYLATTLGAVLDASGLEGAARSFVTDVAYGCVRHLPYLDAALAPSLRDPQRLPPRVRAALRLGAYELLIRHTPPHAAVHAWVEVVKAEAPGLAGLANAVLRKVRPPAAAAPSEAAGAPGAAEATGARGAAEAAGAPGPAEAPAFDEGPEGVAARALRYALPTWLWRRFVAAMGPVAASRAAAGMLEPEPLWLTAFAPDAAARLEAEGCEVAAGPIGTPDERPAGVRFVPVSLRVRSPVPLARLEAYRAGSVQPQNPAALAAALLLGAEPGERVLDLASGRGVKSAVLAALGARVVAVERDARRSRAADANLARLGLAVEHVTGDLLEPLTLPPAERVLLDAPCSGTGTLRGHPEIKLRLDEEGVGRLAEAQRVMLAHAAALVRPGGTLVYAVCSLTPEEGPAVVAGLLAERPDFEPFPFELPVPSVAAGPGRFVLPVAGLDGFYLARLRRRDAPAD